MSETAEDIIRDAMSEIVTQAADSPIEADEALTAIRYMNRFMNSLDASNVSLGWTTVTSTSSEITIPLGAIDGLVANLAIMLAPQYDAMVSLPLQMRAKKGLEVMLALGVNIENINYPDTLPRGSGNEGDSYRRNHYYPNSAEDILSETDAQILLED